MAVGKCCGDERAEVEFFSGRSSERIVESNVGVAMICPFGGVNDTPGPLLSWRG